MSLLTCVEQFHYPQLALDLLDLSPNETDTAEDPSAFFTHYLRQRVLDALAHCDALMAVQAEVRSPLSLHRRVCGRPFSTAWPSARRWASAASRRTSWTAWAYMAGVRSSWVSSRSRSTTGPSATPLTISSSSPSIPHRPMRRTLIMPVTAITAREVVSTVTTLTQQKATAHTCASCRGTV